MPRYTQELTLSYITPFVSKKYEIHPELLYELFVVLTPIGESIISRRVYHDCVVTVCVLDTLANPIELEIIHFDVIMGIDWLSSCYATMIAEISLPDFIFQEIQS